MKKLKGSIDAGVILLAFVLSFAAGVAYHKSKDSFLSHLKNLKKPVVSQTYHNHQVKPKKNGGQ